MLRIQGSDQTTDGSTVKNRGALYWAEAWNLTTSEGINGQVCPNGTAFDLHSQAIGFDSPSLVSLDPPRKFRDHNSN